MPCLDGSLIHLGPHTQGIENSWVSLEGCLGIWTPLKVTPAGVHVTWSEWAPGSAQTLVRGVVPVESVRIELAEGRMRNLGAGTGFVL
jgi:hypothetical protein